MVQQCNSILLRPKLTGFLDFKYYEILEISCSNGNKIFLQLNFICKNNTSINVHTQCKNMHMLVQLTRSINIYMIKKRQISLPLLLVLNISISYTISAHSTLCNIFCKIKMSRV